MDTTVRNLDERAYRAIRARAVMEGRTVGDLINEAIRGYLARPAARKQERPQRTPAEAAAHIRELRKGNILPAGVTIRELIDEGRG